MVAVTNQLDDLDSCAFEGYEANFVPMGRPAPAVGLRKHSRVFRDDLPRPLPLGFHRALQWVGVVLVGTLLTLSALFYLGTLKVETLAAYFVSQA